MRKGPYVEMLMILAIVLLVVVDAGLLISRAGASAWGPGTISHTP